MKQRFIIALAISLIFVVAVGYWLGTTDFTGAIEDFDEKQTKEEEKVENDRTGTTDQAG